MRYKFWIFPATLDFKKAKLWTTKKNVEPATEEDPLTQGSHDLVECHVFGDQPLGVRFSCCEVAITGTKYPFFVDKCLLSGETAGPTSSEGFFFLYLYLRNVVLHLVLS